MSVIESSRDLYICINSLLNKVKLESKNGEDLLNGLLNVNTQCKNNGLCLLYGNLIFDKLIYERASFFEVFTNTYFCKHILKHITIGRYGAESASGKRRIWSYGYMSPNNQIRVRDSGEGIIPLGIKEAIAKLKKEGISTKGQLLTLKYGIDHNFNLHKVYHNSCNVNDKQFVNFSVDLTNATSGTDSFFEAFIGKIHSGNYFISGTAVGKGDFLLTLYTCGLIGNLNISSPLTDKSTPPHDLILGVYLRYALKDCIYHYNEMWRFDENSDSEIASDYSIETNARLGRGFSHNGMYGGYPNLR